METDGEEVVVAEAADPDTATTPFFAALFIRGGWGHLRARAPLRDHQGPRCYLRCTGDNLMCRGEEMAGGSGGYCERDDLRGGAEDERQFLLMSR